MGLFVVGLVRVFGGEEVGLVVLVFGIEFFLFAFEKQHNGEKYERRDGAQHRGYDSADCADGDNDGDTNCRKYGKYNSQRLKHNLSFTRTHAHILYCTRARVESQEKNTGCKILLKNLKKVKKRLKKQLT